MERNPCFATAGLLASLEVGRDENLEPLQAWCPRRPPRLALVHSAAAAPCITKRRLSQQS